MKNLLPSKKFYYTFLTAFLIIGLSMSAKYPTPVYAKDSNTVILTGLTIPGEDSISVGIEGSYVANQQEALNRINEIRYEACANGYPDPRDPDRALTLEDYVPIKWSSALEQYARLRAAEATVYPDHGRPGSNVYIDANNKYTTGSAEVLAWPGGSLVSGVNLWYAEKTTWVNRLSGVTGHYTSMINPNNTYVGLGGFSVNIEGLGSSWGGCVCGRFMGTPKNNVPDESMAPELNNVIQVFSMKQSYLSSPEIQQIVDDEEVENLTLGDTAVFAMVRKATFPPTAIDESTAVVLDMDAYTYSSSNPQVLEIDAYGNATALKAGSTTIIAQSAGGLTYQKNIKIKSDMKTPTLSKITAGKKQLTVKFKVTKNTTVYASGFQVQTATNKKFKKNLKNTTLKPKYTYWEPATNYTKTIKKLKSGKKYYVRVRAYMNKNGKKYYTDWSKTKTIKVK